MKTIKDLRKLIEGLPDGTPVVFAGSDHAADYKRGAVEKVVVNSNGDIYEYFGDEYLEEDEAVTTALVLGYWFWDIGNV